MNPCACGCGELVQFLPFRRIYFSDECNRRKRKPLKKTPQWRAARVERSPALKYIHIERQEVNARGLSHLCMYCEVNRTMAPGGWICRDRECLTRWNSDYAKGRREYARMQRDRVPQPPVACACGCGATFAFDWSRTNRRYLTRQHNVAHWKKLNAARVEEQRRRHNEKKRAVRAFKALPFRFGGSSRKALSAFWE